MINNFNVLRPFLTFNDEQDFYYLQIIARRKENPELKKTEKVIKNYYIENLEYLDRKKSEIIQLCKTFNARAYLRLNKRNYKDLSHRANKLLADYLYSGQYRATSRIWDRVAGRYDAAETKIWVIDVDDVITDEQKKTMGKMIFGINQLQPYRVDGHVLKTLPSTSGYHLLTTPFNVKDFNETVKPDDLEVSIHKDNPTNLYIP